MTTGGSIAPVAVVAYSNDGHAVATIPEGGMTFLDQFAIAALEHTLKLGLSERKTIRQCTDLAYAIGASMLESREAAMQQRSN